jgi:hypothetical protein
LIWISDSCLLTSLEMWRATVARNIDITKNIRIQGAAGADGGTETGVGMHWDCQRSGSGVTQTTILSSQTDPLAGSECVTATELRLRLMDGRSVALQALPFAKPDERAVDASQEFGRHPHAR